MSGQQSGPASLRARAAELKAQANRHERVYDELSRCRREQRALWDEITALGTGASVSRLLVVSEDTNEILTGAMRRAEDIALTAREDARTLERAAEEDERAERLRRLRSGETTPDTEGRRTWD